MKKNLPTEMTKSVPVFPLTLLIVLILTLSSYSTAASDSVYESLLGCLQTQLSPIKPAAAASIPEIVFAPSNSSFTTLLRNYIRNSRYNVSNTQRPLILLTPSDETQVSAAVVCAKKLGFQLRIRSGGHDYDGLSYVSDQPFFILDMFNFRSVDVDIASQSAWVGAGATLGELYYSISRKSRVHGFPAGVCPTVGVGGHVSGGGYGNMLRRHGLSVDHVVDARMVDAKGRILDRTAMGEEVFWAIRGGGGASFGVILSFKIKLVPVPTTVTVFRLGKTLAQNATDMVLKWQSVAPTTDNNLFMRLLLQLTTVNGQRTVRATVVALYLGNADTVVTLLKQQFPELGLRKQDCLEMSWIESVVWWDDNEPRRPVEILRERNLNAARFLKRKSDYVQSRINREGLEGLWRRMIDLVSVGMVWNPYGGRMNEINSSATPFPHRSGNLFKVQYSTTWDDPTVEADNRYMSAIRSLHDFTTGFVSKNPRSAYINYRDVDIGVSEQWRYEEGKVYGLKYFNGNYDRLVSVKTEIDPDNFFRNQQSIPPRTSWDVGGVSSAAAQITSTGHVTLTALLPLQFASSFIQQILSLAS